MRLERPISPLQIDEERPVQLDDPRFYREEDEMLSVEDDEREEESLEVD